MRLEFEGSGLLDVPVIVKKIASSESQNHHEHNH